MNVEEIREYCITKKGVTEEFPFDEHTLVFKVKGKMFALIPLNKEPMLNLKCNPEKAIELREHYSCVQPGWHMNKRHWNTIILDDSVGRKEIEEWIDHSYSLITSKLNKRQKEELGMLS